MSRQHLTTKLYTVADVLQGQSPESKYYSDSEGTPFLQGNRTFGNLYPYFDTYTNKITKLAKKGEILMTVRAPVGALNIAPCDLCIGRGLASIKAKNGDNQFIYYALKYNVDNLIKQGGATTFDSVNKDLINNFELIMPVDETDRIKVSALLSTIDEKIELNNKINFALEQMIKTLYEYWFLQFDFPDADGKPYKSSGGDMVYNEDLKRDIPKDWKAVSIEKILAASKNGDWGEDESHPSLMQVYCVRGADINALNGQTATLEPPIRHIRKDHGDRLLRPDDLIVEISGGSPTQSTGRVAHIGQKVFSRFESPLVCSNFCKAISFKDKLHSYIVKQYWNKLYEAGIFFNFEGKTSGIKNLMFDQLIRDVYLAIPENQKLIEEFYKISVKNDEQIQNNLLQNKKLAELRDWLLPMLMNGQIRVVE